ncbi:pyridine nucleotide-disulfide oxidoreductase-domain-containing protein [Cadophora sp. MPI-SDFR-AT-0126]|nr:pyridine nucleotide-disulfide oxidoreductase-domain-containing protein [Leotiomycetes sp. MPI-SDFR-AT-0126]
MGMALVDTVFTDNQKATFAIVDRYHRLPSKFYGVNSRELGEDKLDLVGWNKGMFELATVDEVLAYYTRALEERFLPSGRVTCYPICEHTSGREFHSIDTGHAYSVREETRIVDATFMRVRVPSMGPPAYRTAEDVKLVTPNALATLSRPYANCTVVGAGKTGIDACSWMLSIGIEPSKITWIMPRDSWFWDPVMAATSVDDLLTRLGAAGSLLRLFEVWPTMYRCATVSVPELEQVRRIKNIVRMGRVRQISADEMVLDGGRYSTVADTLYIDCTADGLKSYPPVPVFNGNRLTLQAKNSLCAPISQPNQSIDWLKTRLRDNENGVLWEAEPKTVAWLGQCRLDLFRGIMPPLPDDPEERQIVLQTKETTRQANQSLVSRMESPL